MTEPVADETRSILDGHVVLSRRVAESGRYPAIDIEASISRAMNDICAPAHREAAQRFRHLYATWSQNRDLLSVGAYKPGSDPALDEAVAYQPELEAWLRQDMHEPVSLSPSLDSLAAVVAPRSEEG